MRVRCLQRLRLQGRTFAAIGQELDLPPAQAQRLAGLGVVLLLAPGAAPGDEDGGPVVQAPSTATAPTEPPEPPTETPEDPAPEDPPAKRKRRKK